MSACIVYLHINGGFRLKPPKLCRAKHNECVIYIDMVNAHILFNVRNGLG